MIRLSLFWAGLALYSGHTDSRQGAGYALLILNAVVELALAASLYDRQPGLPLMVAGLILLTSLLLGFVGWLRFARHLGERPNPRMQPTGWTGTGLRSGDASAEAH